MTKVYIPNKGPHNYDDARNFGDLIFCSDGPLDKLDTSQMYRVLSDSMRDSHPVDYLLITSLTSLCCVASAILSAKHGELHLLIFHGDQYLPKSLYFNV